MNELDLSFPHRSGESRCTMPNLFSEQPEGHAVNSSEDLSKAVGSAPEDLDSGRELLEEILTKLDDVYGVVLDGPEFNTRDIALLSLLPEEDLQQAVNFAEEYAANVADYAYLAREALSVKRK